MAVRLIAFDLDRTLLESSDTPSRAGLQALGEASQRGVILVPATGRALMRIPAPVLELPGLRYLILLNGAVIYDIEQKAPLWQSLLTGRQARSILAYAQSLDICTDIYVDGQVFAARHCYENAPRHILDEALRRRYLLSRVPVENLDAVLQAEDASPEKMFLHIADDHKRAQVSSHLQEAFGVSVTSSAPYSLEASAKGVDKGNALRTLCEMLEIPLHEVMAVGDSINDMGMLRTAGLSVAMGNALEDIHITADNDHDGLAQAVRRFL